MPIPFIIWGLAAAGLAAYGYSKKDKIEEFANSDTGKKLRKKLAETVDSAVSARYDDEARERARKQAGKLLEMDKISDSGSLLDIAGSVVVKTAYLKKRSRRDIGILSMYLAELESRSKTLAEREDDSASKDMHRRVKSLHKLVSDYSASLPDED